MTNPVAEKTNILLSDPLINNFLNNVGLFSGEITAYTNLKGNDFIPLIKNLTKTDPEFVMAKLGRARDSLGSSVIRNGNNVRMKGNQVIYHTRSADPFTRILYEMLDSKENFMTARVLEYLALNGRSSLVDIAHANGGPNVRGKVDALAKEGLVEKNNSYVTPTPRTLRMFSDQTKLSWAKLRDWKEYRYDLWQ